MSKPEYVESWLNNAGNKRGWSGSQVRLTRLELTIYRTEHFRPLAPNPSTPPRAAPRDLGRSRAISGDLGAAPRAISFFLFAMSMFITTWSCYKGRGRGTTQLGNVPYRMDLVTILLSRCLSLCMMFHHSRALRHHVTPHVHACEMTWLFLPRDTEMARLAPTYAPLLSADQSH